MDLWLIGLVVGVVCLVIAALLLVYVHAADWSGGGGATVFHHLGAFVFLLGGIVLILTWAFKVDSQRHETTTRINIYT